MKKSDVKGREGKGRMEGNGCLKKEWKEMSREGGKESEEDGRERREQ